MQVKIWFQNRRNKWKRQVAAEMEAARTVRQHGVMPTAAVHRAATIHTRPASLQFLTATSAANAVDMLNVAQQAQDDLVHQHAEMLAIARNALLTAAHK
jgi:hypothetical protein